MAADLGDPTDRCTVKLGPNLRNLQEVAVAKNVIETRVRCGKLQVVLQVGVFLSGYGGLASQSEVVAAFGKIRLAILLGVKRGTFTKNKLTHGFEITQAARWLRVPRTALQQIRWPGASSSCPPPKLVESHFVVEQGAYAPRDIPSTWRSRTGAIALSVRT